MESLYKSQDLDGDTLEMTESTHDDLVMVIIGRYTGHHSVYLTKPQARRLAKALLRFAGEGSKT